MGKTLGIAGTAKNTGKTTTLQAVVRAIRRSGTGVYLTSIGYDGEEVDTVTGLPKPKVVVEEGDMVATALSFLRSSPARFARLRFTGVDCALGPVYSGMATNPGRVVLAGPLSTSDVGTVLRGAPPERTVLLDGAFSRLAPMVLADALILATGASRSPDPRRVAAEMEALSVVFGLPEHKRNDTPGDGSVDAERLPQDSDLLRFPEGLFVEGQDLAIALRVAEALGLDSDSVVPPPVGSKGAAGPPPVTTGQEMIAPAVTVQIDGVVNPSVFLSMAEKVGAAVAGHGLSLDFKDSGEAVPGSQVEFIFGHPVYLLLSGDIAEWVGALDKAHRRGFRVGVRRRPDLLGFTVNPFRPEYDPIRNAYAALYVDAGEYLREIRSMTQVRSTDIVYEGTRALESWLEEAGFAGP